MQISKFQIAILILFGLAIVGGVIAFSVYKGSGGQTIDLSVWGVMPQTTWNAWYSSSPIAQNNLYRITYTTVSEQNFDNELINALAEGRGPDIVIAFHDRLLKNQTKLLPIPYTSFSKRDYQNTFIDASSALMTTEGEIAVPLLIDPLVLFHNKDTFASYSLVEPPTLWEQMYPLAQGMTVKDPKSGNIVKSAVPLGSFSNILYAKDILATMIFQAGGKIVSDTEGFITATLSDSFGAPYPPANSALLFFTEFSNPAKVFYTWNRSLSDSLSKFSAGDSAMYVGYASDLKKIRDKNPNLVFDASFLPQATGATKAITYGKMLSMAVPRGTEKWSSAFGAIFEMMSPQSVDGLYQTLRLPPARRDLLKNSPEDPFEAVFFDSAIRAFAWKDPDTDSTSAIFQNMIDSVTSGRVRIEDAVFTGQKELQAVISTYKTR